MTKKILVAVDLEDEALMAKMLKTAGEIAALHNAQITLVHVASVLPTDVALHLPEDYEKQMVEEVKGKLGKLAGGEGFSAEAVQTTVRFGATYQEILAEAEDHGADLIIVGCHRPDITDYLLGSNAARVVRHASCSVFVVR